MDLIQQALDRGAKNLSEYESKMVLSAYGIPVTREKTVRTEAEATAAGFCPRRIPGQCSSELLGSIAAKRYHRPLQFNAF